MNDTPRKKRLILASGSASRKLLLSRLKLPFEVIAADIDESAHEDETPAKLVERLSRGKAHCIAVREQDATVIGSDQVAVFDGRATSKPGTMARAEADLARFSGETVKFLTGVCVRREADAMERYFMDVTEVQFRKLSRAEIQRYLAVDDTLQCAGAFKVESLGPVLFEAVNAADPTALPGLPLIGVSRALRDFGFALP